MTDELRRRRRLRLSLGMAAEHGPRPTGAEAGVARAFRRLTCRSAEEHRQVSARHRVQQSLQGG